MLKLTGSMTDTKAAQPQQEASTLAILTAATVVLQVLEQANRPFTL